MRRFNTAITGACRRSNDRWRFADDAGRPRAAPYLVNGHPATAKEDQILRAYVAFAAGAWPDEWLGHLAGGGARRTSFPSPACRSATTCSMCRSTAARDADRLALKQKSCYSSAGWKRSTRCASAGLGVWRAQGQRHVGQLSTDRPWPRRPPAGSASAGVTWTSS